MNYDSLFKPFSSIGTTRGMIRYHTLQMIGIVLFSGSFALSAQTTPKQTFTAYEATVIARDNNPKIRQYRERLKQKKCDVRSATGNFLPTITLTAGYTALNDPLTIDLDPIRSALISMQSSTLARIAVDSLVRATGGILSREKVTAFSKAYGSAAEASLDALLPHFIDTLKEQYYPSANISVIQPLFTGGKIRAGQRAALANEAAAKFDMSRIRNETTREVITRYTTIALLKQLVVVRQNVLIGMLRHEKDARSLSKAGVIPKNSLLRAGVAVAEAKRALENDSNRLVLAYIALSAVMNLPDTVVIDIADTLSFHEFKDGCDRFIAAADSGQPQLKYIRTRRDAVCAKLMVEQSSLYPRIAAFGKIELFPNYLSALDPKWVVGANLSLNLFSGGKRISGIQAAKYQLQEIDALAVGASRKIRLWVRSAYTGCINANTQYVKLFADQTLAEENLKQCKCRFESGFGTTIEIIDAELVLQKNRIDRISSLYDFNNSLIDLYTATGNTDTAVALLFPGKER